MPLFVRAGAILPLGPVKQHTQQKSSEPLAVTVYPGADGSFLLYEDDGKSFDYRRAQWMGIQMIWDNAHRILDLHLAPGSRMMPPLRRNIEIRCALERKSIVFDGRPMEVHL
jgi:alpha-glucosidase (family GH31 glycosyl hydrolase)